MIKTIIAIPHSHSWFWTQTCVASLIRYPPVADTTECQIVVVDNSPWSPAIRGITDTKFAKFVKVVENHKSNKFHASALDCIVDTFDFDYLMAWETDVLALRPDWLQWFVDQMRLSNFAVGHWHHEQFINPSCTLYRGDVLRAMAVWCRERPERDTMRWGERFDQTQSLYDREPARDYVGAPPDDYSWVRGPFADKRGWPQGTALKESPSGQCKGPGWYEPGQMLHHWAVEAGYTYTVCPTFTHDRRQGMPVQTLYGGYPWDRELTLTEMRQSGAATVHLWGGTRALDIIKHDVTCEFVKSNTPYWLEREARFWLDAVDADTRATTLELIRQYGWHYRGQGSDTVTDRDRAASEYVRKCYAAGGVEW